jgi:tetratricopeptide (TPR) repeat protein
VRLGLALLLVALTAQVAAADGSASFDRARARKQQLDFAGALADLRRGLADGGNVLSAVVDAYLLAGELAAGLDRTDEAVDAFQHALELDPARTLPDGTSPKIVAPFQTARTWAQAHGRLTFHTTDEPDHLVIVIDNDPLGLVAGAHAVVVDAAGQRSEVRVHGTAGIRVPRPAAFSTVGVEIVDAHGNELGNLSIVRPSVAAGPPSHHARPRLLARWEIWAIAALGTGAIGAVEGLRVRNAQDEWDRLRADDGAHDYSELVAVEHRGRNAAIGADVGLGLAAVTGAIAVVLAIRELGGDRDTLAIVPVSAGFGVGLAGQF